MKKSLQARITSTVSRGLTRLRGGIRRSSKTRARINTTSPKAVAINAQEGDEQRRVSMYVPASLVGDLDRLRSEGETRAHIIRMALMNYVARSHVFHRDAPWAVKLRQENGVSS